jgi:hypothetical protein
MVVPRPGPKGLPVRQLPGDVLVAAQRVEVVLIVVVQRSFVTQPFPGGVRIVIDVEVERVVVHLGGAGSGHGHVLLPDSNSLSVPPRPSPGMKSGDLTASV